MAFDVPIAFGPYQLLRALGKGAMGDVFLARPFDRNRGLPPALVIKRLRDDVASEEGFRRRFAHEAQIATAIDSPNIVKVYDAGTIAGMLYIAMEYIPGWPLSRVIEERRKDAVDISTSSAADVMEGVLLGLSALHRASGPRGSFGIVHRDIAPKNIMLGEDGRICLIDLGIGKSKLRSWKTRTGALLGSLGYMAPEQVEAREVDPRTDLYAAGAVLFELLTLEPYIPAGSIMDMLQASMKPRFRPPSSVRPDLPRSLDLVMEQALAVDPKDRFQSAQAFIDALRTAVPRNDDRPWMGSLIGDLLWGELSAAGTAMTQLFAEPPNDPAPSDEGTVVFATRTGIAPPRGARMSESRTVGHEFNAPFVAGVVLAAASCLVLGAFVVNRVFLREREVRVIPSRSAAPQPGVTPVAQPRAVEEEALAPAQAPEAVEPPRKKVAAAPIRSPVKKINPERGPPATQEPAPPPHPAPTFQEEDLGRLIDRANRLRRRLGSGSPQAKELNGLIGELSEMIANPFNAARDVPIAKRIAARIDSLERSTSPE